MIATSESPQPEAVAEWLAGRIDHDGRLVQRDAASHIRAAFGPHLTKRNRHGNWALDGEVLKAFRRLTPTSVVWSRSQQTWRRRLPTDPAGRRMVA